MRFFSPFYSFSVVVGLLGGCLSAFLMTLYVFIVGRNGVWVVPFVLFLVPLYLLSRVSFPNVKTQEEFAIFMARVIVLSGPPYSIGIIKGHRSWHWRWFIFTQRELRALQVAKPDTSPHDFEFKK